MQQLIDTAAGYKNKIKHYRAKIRAQAVDIIFLLYDICVLYKLDIYLSEDSIRPDIGDNAAYFDDCLICDGSVIEVDCLHEVIYCCYDCYGLIQEHWPAAKKTTYKYHLLLCELVGKDVSIHILRIISFRPVVR